MSLTNRPMRLYPLLAGFLLTLLTASADLPSRTLVVPDLHGDFDGTVKLLKGLDLIDDALHWIGGQATVIQMGDVLDRGPKGLEILDLFDRLGDEAEKAGGKVVMLMGNHELLNLHGMLRYVSKEEMRKVGGEDAYRRLVSPKGKYGELLLKKRRILYQQGGDLFVHAGLLPHHVASRNVTQLDAEVMATIRSGKRRHPLLLDKSPLWTRDMVHQGEVGSCQILDDVLRQLGRHEGEKVTRIFVGHTVLRSTASLLCGGRLVATDVALSKWMGRYGGNTRAVELSPSGLLLRDVSEVQSRPTAATELPAGTVMVMVAEETQLASAWPSPQWMLAILLTGLVAFCCLRSFVSQAGKGVRNWNE